MNRIDIDTARIRTSCWVSGPENGTPLLLIHGNLVTDTFWRDVAARLPDDVRIVAPDLRGFGRTEAKPIDATRGLDDWIDDLESLVKKIAWSGRQPHGGGGSRGGGLAMGYANKAPGHIATLTPRPPTSPRGAAALPPRHGAGAHPGGTTSTP